MVLLLLLFQQHLLYNNDLKDILFQSESCQTVYSLLGVNDSGAREEMLPQWCASIYKMKMIRWKVKYGSGVYLFIYYFGVQNMTPPIFLIAVINSKLHRNK